MITLFRRLSSTNRRTFATVSAIGLVLGVGGYLAPPASASGGSYSIDFMAARPLDYGKYQPSGLACPAPTGSSGRASNPLVDAAFGHPTVAVSSLAPKDLALGQIVAFETEITVSGSTAPENGVITFDPYWLAKTTSGDDFGYDPADGVYCAFVDPADSANHDTNADGHGDAYVSAFQSSVSNAGTKNEQIDGHVTLAGLDDGDNVIVEMWVVLKKTIPAKSSGNVASGMTGAVTGTGDTINVGNQTVPLLRVQEFFTAQADLSVTKTDSPDPVIAGNQLTYSIEVKNNSADTTANSVTVTDTLDSHTTYVSASGATCSNNNGTLTCDLGALAAGATATFTVTVTVGANAPNNDTSANGTEAGGTGSCPNPTTVDICNEVSVSSLTTDNNAANDSYYQPTNVIPANAVLAVSKSANASYVTSAGQVITYTFTVENKGNVTLTNVKVADPKCDAGSLSAASGDTNSDGKLQVSETWTYTCTHTVTQVEFDAKQDLHNEVTATSDQTAPAKATKDIPVARIKVVKASSTGTVTGAGQQVPYSFTVTNPGSVELTGVTVSDAKCDAGSLSGPTGDANKDGKLQTSETWTYTCTHTVTQAEFNAGGSLANTVKAESRESSPATDTKTIPIVPPGTPLGHVTVVKSVSGDVAGAETSFTFRVSCPAIGYTTDLTVDAASATHSASTPDVLPLGAACQVTETGTYAHWALTSVTPHSTSDASVGTVTAQQGNGAANTVTFVNTRTTGVVTVKKTADGDPAGASTEFAFQVTCPAYVTTAGPSFPWALQTVTVDTGSSGVGTATSAPIPTGVDCFVSEVPTAGWQQTDPAAGADVPVTVPGTAPFTNTRNAGDLQLTKAVHTLAGPNNNVGSFTADDPHNTLVYTLTLTQSDPASLDHTDVVVTDYLPGYGAGQDTRLTTSYVEGSATCSTDCKVTYDADAHLLTWDVGSFAAGSDPVVMTFQVTIDSPEPDATGAIPAGSIANVGYVESAQQDPAASNQVRTPIVAVEAERHHRNPQPSPLPYTGPAVPLPLLETVALVLLGAGVVLTATARRRRHD